MIKKIFNSIFKTELEKLKVEIRNAQSISRQLEIQRTTIENILSGIDISVDVHEYNNKYTPSWAVISLQGERVDYIKFIDLGQKEIYEIQKFLRNFEKISNTKIDASPGASKFLRIDKKYF